MTLDLSLSTSAITMSGGINTIVGTGEEHDLDVGGVWAAGDKLTIVMTDTLTGVQTQIGAGSITGLLFNFVFSYGNKVYLLSGPTVYFSGVNQPTLFNDPTVAGTGFVTMTDYFATSDNLTAVSTYQGRLSFFSRNTIQIWKVDADPNNWVQIQVLPNIGTVSPLSVQSIGDLDVMFLHDTGIRSLRVRDSSLNAFIDDLGSPIDSIIIGLNLTDAERAAACGVVEPSSHRYWLFVKDTIYVYSQFRSSKIAAWSRYDATWQNAGVQTVFVPEKFVVFKGQVWARAGNFLFQYGGVNNNTYDNVVCTAQTPFLNLKTPGTRKTATGVGVALAGAWGVKAGMDSVSKTLDAVYASSSPSFDQGMVPWSSQGTHIQFEAKTTGSTAAVLSEFVFHYEEADEE